MATITRMQTDTVNLGANILRTEFDASTFVEVLRESLVLVPLGRRDDIPRQNGLTMRWNFFSNPAALGSLAEGADPPDSTNFTTTAVTADLVEYGGYTEVSKFLLSTAISGSREEMVAGNAHQASLSIDTIVGNTLNAHSAPTDAGASMTADALRVEVSELLENNAKFHPMSPGGQFFIYTAPVEQAYDMLGEGTPAWFQVKSNDYVASLTQPLKDTVPTAALYNTIVKISTNLPVQTTTAPDDERGYLLGKDAFGVSSLDSNIMQPRIIVTEPEQNSSAPVRNRGTIGWWLLFTTAVIDENRYREVVSDQTGT